MRPGYQVKTFFRGTKKKKDSANNPSDMKQWCSHDGARTFAYKGFVIEKRNSLYRVRDVKLEGFPVHLVSGVFNDARSLRCRIDGGLELVPQEKLDRLRDRNKNVKCGDCGTPYLFRREHLIPYLGGFLITCPFCSHEEFEDRVEWATDENFY